MFNNTKIKYLNYVLIHCFCLIILTSYVFKNDKTLLLMLFIIIIINCVAIVFKLILLIFYNYESF